MVRPRLASRLATLFLATPITHLALTLLTATPPSSPCLAPTRSRRETVVQQFLQACLILAVLDMAGFFPLPNWVRACGRVRRRCVSCVQQMARLFGVEC